MSAAVFRVRDDSLQEQFASFRRKIQIYGGGYGNGKTSGAIVLKLLPIARDYPGANILVARSTYPRLNDTVRKEFLKWCPASWIESFPMSANSTNTCVLKNGTQINFRYVSQRGKGAQDAGGSSVSNLLSATYDLIVLDQIDDPEIKYKDFIDLLGRLRGSTQYRGTDDTMPDTGPRWFIITLNPTRNWAYRKLIRPQHLYSQRGIKSDDLLVDKQSGEPLIDLAEGSTKDNIDNLPEDFVRTLEATYKGDMYTRFVEGSWEGYEGLVYPDFSRQIHVVPHSDMLDYLNELKRRHVVLNRIGGFDFGISEPCAYLTGVVDQFSRIHVPFGFKEKELSHAKIKQYISQIHWKLQQVCHRGNIDDFADPQIFKRSNSKEVGETVANLLATGNDGIHLRRANNSIIGGITKARSYLAPQEQILNPYTNKLGAPLIYFSDQLEFLFEELEDYFWKRDDNEETVDTPQDKNDHACDALKYMLSKMPPAAEVIYPAHAIEPSYMRWQEYVATNDHRKHRYG